MFPWRRAVIVCVRLVAVAALQTRTSSQMVSAITSPEQEFGAAIGDDYFLATYSQLERYWRKLAKPRGDAAIADVTMGLGRLVLCGPEVTFRAQSHGTFKFLFNAILLARASTIR